MNIRSVAHRHSMEVRTDLSYAGYTTYKSLYDAGKCGRDHTGCLWGGEATVYSGGTVSYTTQTFYTTIHKNIRGKCKHGHSITVTRLEVAQTGLIRFGADTCADGHSYCRTTGAYGNMPAYPLSVSQVQETWNFSSSRANIRSTSSHRHQSPAVKVGLNVDELSGTPVSGPTTCTWGHSACRVTSVGSSIGYTRVAWWYYYTDYRDW